MIKEIVIEDLSCKIYVLTEFNRFQLAELIGNQLNGIVNGKFISTNKLEVEFRENEDFNPKKYRDQDFLFYPNYLEVEPKENIEPLSYISDVRELLNILRKNECQAVAACDFENYLAAEENTG
jgi:hypothetical protein